MQTRWWGRRTGLQEKGSGDNELRAQGGPYGGREWTGPGEGSGTQTVPKQRIPRPHFLLALVDRGHTSFWPWLIADAASFPICPLLILCSG